jgi:TATA-box binding protein (TBP) (component of TFIID and TFIIIB)
METTNIDDDWENFLENGIESFEEEPNTIHNSVLEDETNIPKSTELYISTKTKILYMNTSVDLIDVFWKLPILDYSEPRDGILKKQMKFNSTKPEELEDINMKKANYKYVTENIIYNSEHVHLRDNSFKDVRKVSIGISKKDIMSYRSKEKSAFYNCFVVNLRIKHKENFKEVHVKVFNTGKLEIPGIQCEKFFEIVKSKILETLAPYMSIAVFFDIDKEETVLVNSNFHCGYYINRDKLFDILKYKYNIQASYDPCSYPGIQCKYMKPDKTNYISFMIFRTGSVLIVGKCDDIMLNEVYEYLKKLLHDEYATIATHTDSNEIKKETKPKKIRKKVIYLSC